MSIAVRRRLRSRRVPAREPVTVQQIKQLVDTAKASAEDNTQQKQLQLVSAHRSTSPATPRRISSPEQMHSVLATIQEALESHIRTEAPTENCHTASTCTLLSQVDSTGAARGLGRGFGSADTLGSSGSDTASRSPKSTGTGMCRSPVQGTPRYRPDRLKDRHLNDSPSARCTYCCRC